VLGQPWPGSARHGVSLASQLRCSPWLALSAQLHTMNVDTAHHGTATYDGGRACAARQVMKGVPIEHIRHMRRGGYEYGSTFQLPGGKHYVE